MSTNSAIDKQSVCMHTQSFQLCLTLCNPMDCSTPGSSVRGIFQARIRIPEWVVMPFSRGSYWPRTETTALMSLALQADSLPTQRTWEAPKTECIKCIQKQNVYLYTIQ